jgi:Ca2+/Na+ antiporter
MRPSVVLTGFLLGSSGAICFGLLGVAFIFWVLGPDHPQLSVELGPLLTHLSRFAVLALASAASFYALLRQRPWRRFSVALLLLCLVLVVAAYAWPGA